MAIETIAEKDWHRFTAHCRDIGNRARTTGIGGDDCKNAPIVEWIKSNGKGKTQNGDS